MSVRVELPQCDRRGLDALIQAEKPYDLVVLPGMSHSGSHRSSYWRDAVIRYFQEHLNPEG